MKRSAAVVALGAAAALILLFSLPVCPTARILRVPCPGCGLSRASQSVLQGHFAEAWNLHPMVFVIVPVLGLYVLAQAVAYVFPGLPLLRRVLASKWVDRAMIAVMVLAVLLWASRFFGAFGGPVPV